MAQDLENMQQLGKMKDEDKPEIDKDIKDAKAEKAKLQEMVGLTCNFKEFLKLIKGWGPKLFLKQFNQRSSGVEY